MINKTEKELMSNWKDKEQMMVSIACVAYNQDYCISETLDGFLMQETSFPFEILINDDASTDRTAEIIKEYEDKFPDIVKPVYQSENKFSHV
jgi:glycosyltransferase involved in cell wall biosynthesis